jgi:hypothetical protein
MAPQNKDAEFPSPGFKKAPSTLAAVDKSYSRNNLSRNHAGSKTAALESNSYRWQLDMGDHLMQDMFCEMTQHDIED